jgi:RND family efflux transporter MFP subunit
MKRLAIAVSGVLFATGLPAHSASAPGAPALGAPAPIQGVTEPFRFATISSEIAGRITAVRINEGGRARKGDTIMVLDAEEAFLEAERSRLIAESDAELAAARLKSEVTKRDLTATRLVYDSTRSVSEEELWKKELDHNLAKTEVDRLTMTKQKSVLEYKIALQNLKRHYVIAPYDGIVAQRFLNEGETCKPQEPLIKFVDVSRCRFIAYIPVSLALGLGKGSRINLLIGDPKKNLSRSGVIDFISPVVDQASGLRTTKVVFDNPDGAIQPGVPGFLQIEK